MIFVDGENFTIRGQEFAAKHGIVLPDGQYFKKNVFLWLPINAAESKSPLQVSNHVLEYLPKRSYYFTCCSGGHEEQRKTQEALRGIGFEPMVFHKVKDKKTKAVDIAMATEMLCHAFRDNYDAAILVALMLGFCILVALFGQRLMSTLYPAAGETRHLLIVIALSSLIATAGVPAAIALTSANKAANLSLVMCVAALINLVIILLLLPLGGLLGAAYGTLLAELVGTVGRWFALYRAVGIKPGISLKTKQELVLHA